MQTDKIKSEAIKQGLNLIGFNQKVKVFNDGLLKTISKKIPIENKLRLINDVEFKIGKNTDKYFFLSGSKLVSRNIKSLEIGNFKMLYDKNQKIFLKSFLVYPIRHYTHALKSLINTLNYRIYTLEPKLQLQKELKKNDAIKKLKKINALNNLKKPKKIYMN